MKVHFIAIGGSAMHNLAMALHLKGYEVSGSDDEIFDPAKSRLARYGLLPDAPGWFSERITADLDAVILGMHARADNPELLRAKELGLKIYSYPEYLYEQSKDKTRVVIGGSHGKTSVTAMILHVLKDAGMECDYMVGAQLEGYDIMVRLSATAKVMVLEGDEYLTSPIDRRPKFHLYHPDIAVVNGIAWDHINVFPTFENYVSQFDIFAKSIETEGTFAYYEGDAEVRKIAENLKMERPDITFRPYDVPEYRVTENGTELIYGGEAYPLQVFGRHNMQNIFAAWQVCRALGVGDAVFLNSIVSFKGASRRLEKIAENKAQAVTVYKDFAHSPSKLQATIAAVKEQYPQRRLVACIELHTFSSLSKIFFSHYRGCMDKADVAFVYFNPKAVEHKKLEPISADMIYGAFGRKDLRVYSDSAVLVNDVKAMDWKNANLLWMTSGNFDGVDEKALAEELVR
ncbi:MAG: Mur ligase family protein [Bacteroides sp.]|nr:Mur ligase family protein [Bacteroides sp.]